jgi:predicted DNA-binding transcriptional regulator AlpA
MPTDNLLKTEDAASYLGLSPSLLNKLRLTGGGPKFLRLAGRAIRYRRADLDAWVDASAVESTSQYPAARGAAQ